MLFHYHFFQHIYSKVLNSYSKRNHLPKPREVLHPFQCSCVKNPRDGGAWWAAVYGVTQSQT